MTTEFPSLANTRIDDAILANVGTNGRKVAMVIALASQDCADALPDEVDEFEYIASRMEALIDEGRLVADGNVENWRHSEVRRP